MLDWIRGRRVEWLEGVIFVTTYPHGVRVHRPHVNPWLVAVVGLAAALIGLGAWVLVDRYAGGSSATENATTLIDNADAAINAGDASTIAALYTSDAVTRPMGGATYYGAQEIGRDYASASAGGLDMHVERVAPVTVDGDFATTWETVTFGNEQTLLLTVYQLKDGQIFRMWGFEPGANSGPLTNAVTE